MRDPRLPTLAIACIVKNEVPYLLEWIAYHRALGITRFFIADNGSSDGTRAALSFLGKQGLVNAISFPGEAGKSSQLPAYVALMKNFSSQADWVAFIDADEFFLPTDGERSLLPFINAAQEMEQAGAVAVNWAIFGSAGHLTADSGLVVERFTRRATEGHSTNNHYKSIVRSSAYYWAGPNPHVFSLLAPFRTVTTSGAPVEQAAAEGRSRTVNWNRLRLNHYVVKSFEEFLFRKRPRGRADIANSMRDMEFFGEHDLNDVEDPMPAWLIDATKAEMRSIMDMIRRQQPPSS